MMVNRLISAKTHRNLTLSLEECCFLTKGKQSRLLGDSPWSNHYFQKVDVLTIMVSVSRFGESNEKQELINSWFF